MDIKELQDLYFCNWEHKFWGPASTLAPNALLTLNHFHNASSVIDPSLQEYFEIYWFENGITGEVKLPGEWNYCYFQGKYYHLEKTKSDGFFENNGDLVEFFFYSVIYDEWSNDFLTNSVIVRGTLAKTGDYLLASRYIHAITPVVTNGNDVVYIDAQERELEKSEVSEARRKARERAKKAGEEYLKKTPNYFTTPGLRSKLTYDKCFYPLLQYWSSEQTLLYQLFQFIARDDLKVFDVDKTKIPAETFNTVFKHSGQYYSIAASEDTSYIISAAINKSKRIKYENLKVIPHTEKSKVFINTLDRETYSTEKKEDNFTEYSRLGKQIQDGKVKYKTESNKIYTIHDELFLKFLDYGLLHTDTKKTRGYNLSYNSSTKSFKVNNRTPKAWRVGNRVWTIEELEKTDWYKVCKPYEQIGVDRDGNPLYFLGFDPNQITDPNTSTIGGKTLAKWLEYIKKQSTISPSDIPRLQDREERTINGSTHRFVRPIVEFGNPGLWYGIEAKQVFFPYDEVNRYKDWLGTIIDDRNWKSLLVTRIRPGQINEIRWDDLLKQSIDKGKDFGLHNTRFGYEIARRPGTVPGSVQYFVPIYEDSDEGLTEDWIFGATAILAWHESNLTVPASGVGAQSGYDTCMNIVWSENPITFCTKNSDTNNLSRFIRGLKTTTRVDRSLYFNISDDVLRPITEGILNSDWEWFYNTSENSYPLFKRGPKAWQGNHITKRIFKSDDNNYIRINPLSLNIDWSKPVFTLDSPKDRHILVEDIYSEIEQQFRLKPIILDLEGYVAYCIIKNGKWHFELLVKDNDYLLEDVKCVRHVFSPNEIYRRDSDTLPTEEEVIQAINSSNVISVYGQEIPVRDRFILDGKDIDWDLHISSLKDKYQAASNFFLVEARSPESLVRLTLDIPKEGVFAIQTISPTDKRDTLMSFVNAESNRFYERSNLDLEKRKFHIDFERESKYVSSKKAADWSSWVGGIFGFIAGAISAGAGVALMATGVGAAPGLALGAFGLSLVGGTISSGASAGSIANRHSEEDQERQDRLRHANENFRLRGEQMHIQHSEAERQEMVQIRNMANANTYGNTTHAINYQSYNEHFGTTDIHLASFRPSGDVLKRLKWYYQEFGYDLMVPDQWCFGITSIRGHIRFSQILENTSCTNNTIKALIEGRLLAGVRVVDLEGKPLEPHEYPDSVLYETCLTRYDQLNEQLLELHKEQEKLKEEREQLTRDIETHRGTISDKDTLIAAKEAEIANKESELAKARQDIIDLNTRIGAVEAECKTKLDTKDQEYRSELASRDETLSTFESGLKQALRLNGNVNRDAITAEARKIFNGLSAATGGLNTYRNWEKAVKQAVGVPESTSAEVTKNTIKDNRDKLNKALEDIKGLEAAKAAEEAKLAKAIEDSRVKENEFNNAMREELNKRSGIEARLREEQETFRTKEEGYKKSIKDLEVQHAKDLEKANESNLTCDQFKKLSGHHTYDLEDQTLIANIEKLGWTLAVTVKYMLLFNVDQRFSDQHLFQPVFKDLYDIGENDLVEGFMETFAAEDWYRNTVGKWLGTEWKGKLPVVANRPRAEVRREQILLQYVDETNDGRLYRGTEWDVIKAAAVVRDDFNYSGVPNIDPVTKKPITYLDLRNKALSNINPANLNQLKELLDDLSVSLEAATMDHLIDVNTFDMGGRSNKCIEAGVLPTAHCDEVNFIRLCYCWLRFYRRIWPTIGDTDVPYGVIMTGITKTAEACRSTIDFSIVNHVKSSTIYPAIGLYTYNPRWPSWSIGGLSIRHGPLNHYIQVMEGYNSQKSYDDIKPVIDGTSGIRIYNKGYTKNIGTTSYPDLYWAYFYYKVKNRELGDIQQVYFTLQPLSLDEYFNSRSAFFTKAVQNISRIFEEGKYTSQKVSIRVPIINYKRLNHMGVTKERPMVDIITLAENIQIDNIFGYETYKYALLYLLTMDLFRVHMDSPGYVDGEDLPIVKMYSVGLVTGRPQPFTTWDQAKFIKYVQDQLKSHKVYKISPDFATAQDLFRWIYRNLKVWKDPTRDSNLERLIRELQP